MTDIIDFIKKHNCCTYSTAISRLMCVVAVASAITATNPLFFLKFRDAVPCQVACTEARAGHEAPKKMADAPPSWGEGWFAGPCPYGDMAEFIVYGGEKLIAAWPNV
jgi:hypothetical protein